MCRLKVRFSQSSQRRGVFNYALKVEVADATGIPSKIFVYHQSPAGPDGNTFAEFDHIATPVDFQEIPEDAASETVPWYRTDKCTVWFRNVSDLVLAKQLFVDDINALTRTYNVLTSENGFSRQTSVEFSDNGVHEACSDDEDTIEKEIDAMKKDISGKVSKDAMSGVEVETNTTEGIRNAVREIGNTLGAKIVKTIVLALSALSIGTSALGAGFSGEHFAQIDLDENPVVVTNVTFDGLATLVDITNVVDSISTNFVPMLRKEIADASNAGTNYVDSATNDVLSAAGDYTDSRVNNVSNELARTIQPLLDIPELIPIEASPTNQLADKNYVNSATNNVLSSAQGYTDAQISEIPPPDFSTNNTELVETIEAAAPFPGDYAAVSNAAVYAAITNALQDAAITNINKSIKLAMEPIPDSKWVFSPADYSGTTIEMGITENAGVYSLAPMVGGQAAGLPKPYAGETNLVVWKGTSGGGNPEWAGSEDLVATRLPRYYLLGDQTDKPLQPAGDYVLSSRTVNGKALTGNVTLTGADIHVDATQGAQTIDAALAGKADKADVYPLLFAKYYPDGNVKSAAEFTPGIRYNDPDTTNRTITVKPFCYTGIATNDNSTLVGRVVIPPFVDAQSNPYITDDGTRYKVVGVSGGIMFGDNANLTAIVAPTTVTGISERAFFGCSSLESVSLPAATSIGKYAFGSCTALATVSLPAATNIGYEAFTSCTSLTSVSLPAATSIRDGAFADCYSLASVSLPAATTIGSGAFDDCNSLDTVDFGSTPRSSVPTLSANAFNGVPNTCKIIVPDSQYDALIAASGWSDLVTAGYKFLKHSEWEYARKYEVEKKADKSDVDPLLFAQYYPDGSVKSVAEFRSDIKYNFDTANRTATVKPFFYTNSGDDNKSLSGRVVIPPFVDSQGSPYISDDGTRFRVVGVAGGLRDGPQGAMTVLVAPITVTTIGEYAFDGGSSLTSVSLPAVTSLGNGTFYDCDRLTSVSLPAVTRLWNGTFYGCDRLTSVSLPAVTNILSYTFYDCISLASVDFGDTPRSSVPSLGENSFSGVTNTCQIIVPYTQYDAWIAADGWRDLPQEFVRHAEKSDKPSTFTTGNLAKFDAQGNPTDSGLSKDDVESLFFAQYYPEGNVKSAAEFTPGIRYNDPDTTNRTITVKPFCNTGTATNDNSSLVGRVVIPPFVDALGNGYISDDGTRFKVVRLSGGSGSNGNANLTAIIAPNTVTDIGYYAFRDCTSLTTVSIPAATDIGNNAFQSCYSLTSVSLPAATTIWDYAFVSCSSLTTVSLPAATTIGREAFGSCTALATVSLPAATTIGEFAFGSCTALATVSLPAATSIMGGAFNSCYSLDTVDFGSTPRSSVPELNDDVFSSVPTSCKFIVPDAQYDAWTAASGWRDLVTAGYKFLRHSEWEYARKYEIAGKVDSMENVSWEDLKLKRDNGNLVPGSEYRITNYVATTSGDMESRSANNPFDIIVTADDERTLNEHARAIIHETVLDFAEGTQYTVGDFCKYNGTVYKCTTAHHGEWNADNFTEESPYFYDCDLAAWDVWYCLDNDTSRFAWADATNGNGVVYRLVDEFQNDCPYDFKGIQFKAYGDADNVWRYTFSNAENDTDSSKSGLEQGVYNNTIGMFSDGQWKLNRIVFLGQYCHSNTFGSNCSYNTFGDGCYDNTFGMDCRYNTFGSGCQYNKFDSGCQYNKFDSNCSYNTFGLYCRYNTFDDTCYGNTFGSNCSYNTFIFYCRYNTFGSNCSYNALGCDCAGNTFGSNCGNNTFGSDCCVGDWRSFDQRYVGMLVWYGNVLRTVRKRYRAHFSTSKTFLVGETLYYDSKYWECVTEHSGAWDESHFTEIQLVGGILSAEEYRPRSCYRYVELEDCVSYVALDCTANMDDGVYYQNVTVSKGICGTESAPKHIRDSGYSQQDKTTYQPKNSQVIEVE